MRTNIDLDEELVAEAMRLTHARTTKELVDRALRELVARNSRRALRELIGRDLIDPDYEVRAVRAAMDRDPG